MFARIARLFAAKVPARAKTITIVQEGPEIWAVYHHGRRVGEGRTRLDARVMAYDVLCGTLRGLRLSR